MQGQWFLPHLCLLGGLDKIWVKLGNWQLVTTSLIEWQCQLQMLYVPDVIHFLVPGMQPPILQMLFSLCPPRMTTGSNPLSTSNAISILPLFYLKDM